MSTNQSESTGKYRVIDLSDDGCYGEYDDIWSARERLHELQYEFQYEPHCELVIECPDGDWDI